VTGQHHPFDSHLAHFPGGARHALAGLEQVRRAVDDHFGDHARLRGEDATHLQVRHRRRQDGVHRGGGDRHGR